jgi:phage host-nuclease inhibitor protein Gam
MISTTENTVGINAMNEIEKRAASYAQLREQLAAIITELNAKIDILTREKMPIIKKLVGRSAEKHAELKATIESHPDLFKKPRTVVFHGIKCGYRKNEGQIEFDDAEAVVKKIKQIFAVPETFLRIIEEPNKDALASLNGRDLKAIGVRITETTDEVVIKPVDSDVDKKVNALLKSAIEDASE